MARLSKSKNPAEVDFSQHYHKNRFHDMLFRWVDRKKISLLKKMYDGKGYRILDLGCGTADVTSKISGCDIYGIDNNGKLLEIARRNGLDVKKGEFDRIPFPDGYFDVVISIDTFEHISSRDKVFAEVRRILKRNGEFVIFTPAYDSPLWVMAEKTANKITGRPSGHITPWTRESLAYFMGEHFKDVSRIRRINFSLGLFVYGKGKK